MEGAGGFWWGARWGGRGRGGDSQLDRLPGVAVVERNVDGALGAGEKQALADGIFADYVHRRVVGQAGGDFFPSLPAVVGAINVRVKIVETETIDRGIDAVGIEV